MVSQAEECEPPQRALHRILYAAVVDRAQPLTFESLGGHVTMTTNRKRPWLPLSSAHRDGIVFLMREIVEFGLSCRPAICRPADTSATT